MPPNAWAMRCTFCQVDVSLLGSTQGTGSRPVPPTKGALIRGKVALPLATGLFGVLVLPTAYFLDRNDMTDRAVVVAIAASILALILYYTQRRVLACILAISVAIVLVAKPFVRPVMHEGQAFSLTSETHHYFLFPGLVMLGVFGWLLVSSIVRRDSRAGDSTLLRFIAVVMFAIGVFGGHLAFGGPTVSDVIKQYEPQGTAMRKQFFQLAKSLPSTGQVLPQEAKLDPAPVWHEGRSQENNIEIVMVEELWNPEETQTTRNLYLSDDLMHCVRWTGPKNPMSSSVMGERAGVFSDRMAHAFGLPWLAAYRRGNAGTEIFVFDLRTGKLAAATVTTGTVGEYSRDRKFVLDTLARITGGTFTLK